MGKRYRSTHRGFVCGDGRGKLIRFINHRFPKQGAPPCEDKRTIYHLENCPLFGKSIFIEEGTGEDAIVAPQPPNADTDTQHIEKMARELKRLGLNVNPKLMKPAATQGMVSADEPRPESPPKPMLIPPMKGFVRTAKKSELIELIEKWGWDIPTDMGNVMMRDGIIGKINELSK